MASRFLTPLLLLLGALNATADWLSTMETIFPPNGIVARGDGFTVSANVELITLDAAGTIRKVVSYEPKAGRVQFEHMAAARDGGLVLAGAFFGEGSQHLIRPIVLRIGADGQPRWARTINVGTLTDHTRVAEAANGDVVVITQNEQALLLARFSSAGNLSWSRTVDRSDWDLSENVLATRDGGVVTLAGAHNRFGAITKFRADGTIAWDRVIGTTDAGTGFYDIIELPGGDLIAVGRTRTYSTSNRQGWLIRLTKDGDIVWQKSIGGDDEDGLYRIADGKGRIVALGGTKSATRGNTAAWVVSFAEDGRILEQTAVDSESHGVMSLSRMYAVDMAGEQVVLAVPGNLKLVTGVFRGPSRSCAMTRAIRLPESEFPAKFFESPRIDDDALPTIETVEFTATTSNGVRYNAKKTCTWSAADAAPPVADAAEVQAPAEEEVFAEEVATLLRNRSFTALDSLAEELRAKRAVFESGASKIRAFYDALARHHSVTALDHHHQLFDAWQAATRSVTSRIARAAFDYDAAWRIRGGGFNRTVVPASGERFAELMSHAAALLDEAEAAGKCDAACFHLQIDVHSLGGWSEPLRKLHALDPTYWEAFISATGYLHPNWGGRAGDEVAFAESAAAASKEQLGDALYAKIMVLQPYAIDVFPLRPQFDWARMRKGFADFQRLHPKSRTNAQAFAHAAYALARDRNTARALFATPLVAWSTRRSAWRDRQEYERAKAWALREPVDAIAKDLDRAAAGRIPAGWPRLVTMTQMKLDDGTSVRTQAFVVETPEGLRGVTAGPTPVTQANRANGLEEQLRTRVRAWTIDANGEKALGSVALDKME